ncbi:MAG: multiubiquitin domain-containing protein [Phycisphaerales bacterium]
MSQTNGQTVTETIDIEEFAKAGRPVPPGHRYRIRIDRERFVVDEPCITGAQILALVDKSPSEFMLSQKLRGGEVRKIGPGDKVDLTKPGVERFMTLPLDPTEGSDNAATTRI